jgi:hypothetical protein
MAAWLEIEGVDVKDLPDVGMTVHVMSLGDDWGREFPVITIGQYGDNVQFLASAVEDRCKDAEASTVFVSEPHRRELTLDGNAVVQWYCYAAIVGT